MTVNATLLAAASAAITEFVIAVQGGSAEVADFVADWATGRGTTAEEVTAVAVRLLRLSEMPWGSLHHLLAPALMRAGSSLERVVLSEPEDDAYRRLRDRLMYLWRGYPISAPWWWS